VITIVTSVLRVHTTTQICVAVASICAAVFVHIRLVVCSNALLSTGTGILLLNYVSGCVRLHHCGKSHC
jgi:hypothetical protein